MKKFWCEPIIFQPNSNSDMNLNTFQSNDFKPLIYFMEN